MSERAQEEKGLKVFTDASDWVCNMEIRDDGDIIEATMSTLFSEDRPAAQTRPVGSRMTTTCLAQMPRTECFRICVRLLAWPTTSRSPTRCSRMTVSIRRASVAKHQKSTNHHRHRHSGAEGGREEARACKFFCQPSGKRQPQPEL